MSRNFSWGDAPRAAPREERRRPLPSAQCSLCGITLPTGLMVPDGGPACTDIRWYCKDAQACTERWTTNLPRDAHPAPTPPTPSAPPAPATSPAPATAAAPAVPRDAPAGTGDLREADPLPAELLGAPEQAWSTDPP